MVKPVRWVLLELNDMDGVNMFNRTHLEHAVITLAVILPFILLGYVTMPWVTAVGIYMVGVFYGREYEQATKRGGSSTSDGMPWNVLRFRYWSLDSILDFVVPLIVILIITGVYYVV